MDAHERRVLPEGWKPYKISELTNVRKQVCGDNLTPYIEIGDVDVESKNYRFKDKKSVENSNITKKDDVIISRVRPTRGAVSIIKEDGIYVSSAFTILAVKDDVSPEYLFYSIAYNKEFFSHLEKHQKGTSYPCCRENDILNFEIIVSPKNIQLKIVDILKKANEIKKLRVQADELTDKLLQSLFLEMFGDPVKNSKGFDFIKLEAVYSREKSGTKCGPFGSALKKDEYVNHGIPVLTMDNICENKFIDEYKLYITNEKYEQLRHYSVEKGDIIISRAGTVGKMCVAKPSIYPSIIDTNLIRLSLDSSKIESIYFTSLMTFFKGRVGRLQTGADGAYTFMNTGVLDNLGLYLPPLPLQQKFARIVEKIEAMRQSQNQSKQQIGDLFSTLMQKAFRGELER